MSNSTLTYDQKSEIRMAFDEAFIAPERRRSLRVKHQVEAQINEWRNDGLGNPFTVRIEDFSPTGVGMIHERELPLGSQFLLKVPREKWGELIVMMTVVRCGPHAEGGHLVGLELSSVVDKDVLEQFVADLRTKRITSKRTQLLLVILGIVGLALTVVLN